MQTLWKKTWRLWVLAGLALFLIFVYVLGIPCLFRTLTGIRCPACGLTHAVLALGRLDMAAAWRHNPLVFLFPPALWLFFTDGKPTHHPVPDCALLLSLPVLTGVWYIYRLVTGC